MSLGDKVFCILFYGTCFLFLGLIIEQDTVFETTHHCVSFPTYEEVHINDTLKYSKIWFLHEGERGTCKVWVLNK